MQSFNFHPVVAEWFQAKFGTPTEPQLRGWPAIQSGQHTLICAPTGSGKTLAAFLAALDKLFTEGIQADLPDETLVLYVSRLRSDFSTAMPQSALGFFRVCFMRMRQIDSSRLTV